MAQLRFSGFPTRIHGLSNVLVSLVGVMGVLEVFVICLLVTSWEGVGHGGNRKSPWYIVGHLPECQELCAWKTTLQADAAQ
jgi:hypothetical protein